MFTRKINSMLFMVFLLFVILFSVNKIFAKDINFYFFWSEECSHCEEAKIYIEKYKETYSSIIFKSYEVSKNIKNRDLFVKKLKEYNINHYVTPTFILEDQIWIGFTVDNMLEIKEKLEKIEKEENYIKPKFVV